MPEDSTDVSSTSFNLVYDGPALQGNEMAVRDLSAALLAADTLFSAADKILNGNRSESRLTVKASFKSGSFGIEFNSTVSLAEKFRDIFAGQTVSSIVNAAGIFTLVFGGVKSLFHLLKWLNRKKPTIIEQKDGRVRFYVGETYFETEREVLALFREFKLRQALEDVVSTPLKKEGISDFAVVKNDQVVAFADKSSADSFDVGALAEEKLDESTRDTWLNILAPAFKAGDKWRVNDGEANFFVAITDPDFTLKVLRNEVEFGAATRLHVRLREIQFSGAKGELHKESTVERVLEIKKPSEQFPIFDSLPGAHPAEGESGSP